MSYVVALYEIDREYGGSEEGGWWYDTGELNRVLCVCRTEEQAYQKANRANALLRVLQRGKRDVGSVLYRGGRHAAEVFERIAPKYIPEERPRYE